MFSWSLALLDEAIIGTRNRELHYMTETKDWAVVDLGAERAVLKRGKHLDKDPRHLYPGLKLTINTLTYEITGYGNEYTRSQLEAFSRHGVVVVKPDEYKVLSAVLRDAKAKNLVLSQIKVVSECAMNVEDEPEQGKLPERSLVVEVVGCEDSILSLNSPTTRVVAIGGQEVSTMVEGLKTPGVQQNSSLVYVMPECVDRLADIIDDVTRSGELRVTFIAKRLWSREMFELLYGCYKGIIPCFAELCSAATTGDHVGMIVEDASSQGRACELLRELSGVSYMATPSVARALAPNTLTAKYGRTVSMPGVLVSEVQGYADAECEGYRTLACRF